MYRRTKKSAQRRQWRPRIEADDDQVRAPPWQPPELRRRIIIEDFDGAEPMTHIIELHRTQRIDCYRAVVDGNAWHARIGWSRVLDGLRRALPRLVSPRHEV